MASSTIPKPFGNESTFGTMVSISTTDYVCPCDGYFVVAKRGSRPETVTGFVNGIDLIVLSSATSTGYPIASLFVKKGMTISVSTNIAGEAGGQFYPLV